MAMNSSVLFAIILIWASSYAAPTTDNVPTVVIPPECDGQRFCSIKPEGYDLLEDRINSLLPEHLIQEYADRMGDKYTPNSLDNNDDKDKHNCPSFLESVSPFSIEELQKENKTETELVIQTKIFKQKVDSVRCKYESLTKEIDTNKPQCLPDVISLSFGMTSGCKETAGFQTLLIYDAEEHKLIKRTISVSVACNCETYHVTED